MMDYDFTRYAHAHMRPDEGLIREAARAMGMERLGPRLSSYLADYGYLAHGSVEMLGITGNQGLASDMVATTRALHGMAPWMAGYVAIHKPTDDAYVVVDPADLVYLANPSYECLIPLGGHLYEYLDRVLREADDE